MSKKTISKMRLLAVVAFYLSAFAASARRHLNVSHFEGPECHQYRGKSNRRSFQRLDTLSVAHAK